MLGYSDRFRLSQVCLSVCMHVSMFSLAFFSVAGHHAVNLGFMNDLIVHIEIKSLNVYKRSSIFIIY